MHHLRPVVCEFESVLSVSLKPIVETFHKPLGKESPCFVSSLVPIDVLQDQVSLLNVLKKPEALEASLILDQLAIKSAHLFYLVLHVSLPLIELNLKMSSECLHYQLFQRFTCLNFLPMLLVVNDLFFVLDLGKEFMIPCLPVPVYNAFLFFQDLQGPEVRPT